MGTTASAPEGNMAPVMTGTAVPGWWSGEAWPAGTGSATVNLCEFRVSEDATAYPSICELWNIGKLTGAWMSTASLRFSPSAKGSCSTPSKQPSSN
ncbi:hypothetical protein GCM10009611_19910 [Arthrobacter roseus]